MFWLFPILSLIGSTVSNFTHHRVFNGACFGIYRTAALHWWHSLPIYTGSGFGFVYFPHCAILMLVFAALPLLVGYCLYHALSIGTLAYATFRFCGLLDCSIRSKGYFLASLFVAVLAQAPILNSQLHVLTTGVLLLAMVNLYEESYWFSAMLLVLAVMLKPTSLIVFLLTIPLFKQLTPKVLLLLALALLLPFICQSPSYVWQQYLACVHSFHASMLSDATNINIWATFVHLFSLVFHVQLTGTEAFALRFLMALLALVACCLARLYLPRKSAVFFIFALGMSYLMLFNSRTENNDYVMVAPALAYSLALAMQFKRWRVVVFHWMVFALLAGNWSFSKLVTPHHTHWMCPFAVTLYAFYLLTVLMLQCWHGFQRRREAMAVSIQQTV